MSDWRNIDVLNRMLAVQCRSLPMYLSYAPPWTGAGDERASATLSNIVSLRRRMAQRIAETIDARRGRPEPGDFPMEFTDTQFLSLEFLVGELIHYQKQDIAALEQCVRELADDPDARALAEEALGAERSHLEALEGLVRQPA